MDIQNWITSLPKDDLTVLIQTQNAEKLRENAERLGYTLSPEDAETIFAALYPARETGALSDDVLQAVAGGVTRAIIRRSGYGII